MEKRQTMTSDADVAARIARQRALALEHAAATTCASLAYAPPRAWDDARALIEASTTAQRQRAETRARVDAWRARKAASAAASAAETAVIEREARARRAREAREEARERAVREREQLLPCACIHSDAWTWWCRCRAAPLCALAVRGRCEVSVNERC